MSGILTFERAVAQRLLAASLRASGSSWRTQLTRLALVRLRRLMARRDPLVQISIAGFDLLMPLSHNLPYYLRENPNYSMNIGRIASVLSNKYPDFTAIDVGANIGDTAAVIRSSAICPILCIEGDDRYFQMLLMNIAAIGGNIEAENVLIGSGPVDAKLVSDRGTARLQKVIDGEHEVVQLVPLSTVLETHPGFLDSRFLKIDTDGFDLDIIRSSLDWIAATKPVVFFEYDPYLLQESHASHPIRIFSELAAIGYETSVVYENVGDYLMTIPMDDQGLIEDVHAYHSGRRGFRYMDVCAFHREDRDVAGQLRSKELELAYRR